MIIGYYSAFPAILSPLMVNFATFYSLVSTSNGRRERGGGGEFYGNDISDFIRSRMIFHGERWKTKEGWFRVHRWSRGIGTLVLLRAVAEDKRPEEENAKSFAMPGYADAPRETSRRLFITAAKRLDVYLRGTAILSKLVSRFIVSAFLNNSR